MSAETTYTNAFRDYQAGKSAIAFQEFSDYLKYFGNTSFAPNVQYYLADIYFRQQDFNNALQSFDAVLEKYPDNPKTADALYMNCLLYTSRCV